MKKNIDIDKKIPATTRAAGYISKIKVSNSGGGVTLYDIKRGRWGHSMASFIKCE